MVDAPATTEGMVWIGGGSFAMGSEDFYPEERPVRASRSTGSGSTRIPSPWPSSGAS